MITDVDLKKTPYMELKTLLNDRMQAYLQAVEDYRATDWRAITWNINPGKEKQRAEAELNELYEQVRELSDEVTRRNEIARKRDKQSKLIYLRACRVHGIYVPSVLVFAYLPLLIIFYDYRFIIHVAIQTLSLVNLVLLMRGMCERNRRFYE